MAKNFTIEKIDGIINKRSEDFISDIESIVKEGVSYMDALVEYAKRNNLEIETVGNIVSKIPVIKEKLTKESETLNLLPKTARL